MLQGFKEFILRGNVIELAVAVVIGGAFTAIVGTLVDAVINPLIALFFNGSDLANALSVSVPTLFGGTSTFAFGAVIAGIINFVAVAAVVYFAIVLPMNKYNEHRAAKNPVEEEAAAPTQEELLAEIRDLLAKQNS